MPTIASHIKNMNLGALMPCKPPSRVIIHPPTTPQMANISKSKDLSFKHRAKTSLNPNTHPKPTMSRTHSTSTAGTIWAELATITLQAFTPDLINRLQTFISQTPSFDTTTHIPLLATLVIRHITLSLRESSLPKTRSFRDVAYHAVMSNKIITKRERSFVRAVSVGKIAPKEETVLNHLDGVCERRNGNNDIFPRARGKDCIKSASMRRLLAANQEPLQVSMLEKPLKNVKEESGDGRKRERKRASIKYVPPRNNENRERRYRQSRHTVCEDTSVPNDAEDEQCDIGKRDATLKEPRVRRERPSRLVQLRRQRLERRKATVT